MRDVVVHAGLEDEVKTRQRETRGGGGFCLRHVSAQSEYKPPYGRTKL